MTRPIIVLKSDADSNVSQNKRIDHHDHHPSLFQLEMELAGKHNSKTEKAPEN